MASKDGLLERIEWEPLRSRREWILTECCADLPDGTKSVFVERDAAYHLSASTIGTCPSDHVAPAMDRLEGSQTPGELVRGPDLVLHTRDGTLEVAGYLARNWTFDHAEPWDRAQFRVAFFTNRITEIAPHDADIAWLTDWYLNGPRDTPWMRASKRSFKSTFSRSWRTSASHPAEFRGAQSGGGSIDHFVLGAEGWECVVHAVPKGIGPEWSSNVGITYLPSPGPMPGKDVRLALEELVGFVFGRRLMRIASVGFDAAGFPKRSTMVSPWGTNVRGVCAKPDFPLLPFSFVRENGASVEQALASLLPTYLQLREPLRLDDVLWRLWLGNEAPSTMDVPIFASGLEILASAWFKHVESKSKGTYMPKDDFDRLLEDELTAISTKVTRVPFGDRMVRKIKRAYETSGNERLRWFFDEIGLPIGPAEESALRARNQAVHPTRAHTAEEIVGFIRTAHVYRTLMVRAILKLLSWKGSYLDYGALGHPVRGLDEPSGG